MNLSAEFNEFKQTAKYRKLRVNNMAYSTIWVIHINIIYAYNQHL